MDHSFTTKRTRRDRDDAGDDSGATPSTCPVSVAASPTEDPELEATLTRLEIDEEFKNSIREMSPGTRNEVLEDIIRTRNMERLGVALSDPFGDLDDDDEEEDDEDINANDHSSGQLPELSFETLLSSLRSFPSQEQGNVGGGGGLEDGSDGFGGRRFVFDPLSMLAAQANIPRGGRGAPWGPLLHVLHQLNEHQARQSMGVTRDVEDMSYEELLELEERMGSVSKGLTPEQIQRCTQLVGVPSEGGCVVCQLDWADSAAEPCVELFDCSHVFHAACLKPWLQINKTCPICKTEVKEFPRR